MINIFNQIGNRMPATKQDLRDTEGRILTAIRQQWSGISPEDEAALANVSKATERNTRRLEQVSRALAALDAQQ